MSDLGALAAALAAEGRATRQRRLLVLAGSPPWTRLAAAEALAGAALADGLWISDAPPEGAQALHGAQARKVLGGEVDAVVFDTWAGLDVEAFGAVTGAVRAGGLLVVLVPPRAAWSDFVDPENARITVHPVPPERVTRRFLQRFLRLLDQAGHWVEEGKALPPLPHRPAIAPLPPLAPDDAGCLTADQHRAVEAIVALAGATPPAALVLTSDRGRGKSAALGLAAARLLRAGLQRIVVTAPRFDGAAVVFAHAQAQLPQARRSRDLVGYRDGRLRFVAPDGLGATEPPELLLVDEAAAIPVPLLERTVALGVPVVFATTVHGYEGSGRGFATRFQSVLDRRVPGWRGERLEEPVRWAAGDPLEHFVLRALLLDGSPVAEAAARRARPEACTFEVVDRGRLAEDEPLLGEAFGLLVLAHYRTGPLDLRFLLDGPNLDLWLVRHEGHVVGAALVAREGGFDGELARAVWEGRRRPRGHLVAQSLAVHGGLEEAPTLRFHRIVRIAVHPGAQGRGIGSRLVAAVRAAAERAGADALGSSFGLSAPLVGFWRQAGLQPVRLGLTREAASGAPALMVLAPLSPAGATLYREARARFLDGLGPLLADPLRDLGPESAGLLRRPGEGDPPPLVGLGERDWKELAAYAAGRRDLELVLGPLARLLDEAALASLDPPARALVEARLVARLPWSAVVDAFGFRGRDAAAAALRETLTKIIRARGVGVVEAELARMDAHRSRD